MKWFVWPCFVILILSISGVFLSTITPQTSICKNCNVIVFAIDTVGADHLPCYGYSRNTAPNLCTFASQNILFQHAYANAPWTLPSDVSMFTSWYPSYHGVTTYENYNSRLPEYIPLLPEILKKNGYTTFFAVPPNDRAFPLKDVYYKGVSEVIPVSSGPDEDLDIPLQRFLASVSEGKKTFLYLHSYGAHGPYVIRGKEKMFTNENIPNIPLSWDGIYGNFSEDFYKYIVDELSVSVGQPNATIDVDFFEKLTHAPTLAEARRLVESRADDLESFYTEYYYFAKINLKDPRQVEYVKALYDQKVFELDTWIGKELIPFLNHPKIKDNTVVIITSEHGEEFLEHGRISHVTLYDSNVKVPFILKVPGLSRRIVDTPVQSADVTPTVLDILGINRRRFYFQGSSLMGRIFGFPMRDRLLVAQDYNNVNDTITVRNADWKLFMKKNNDSYIPYELYDIRHDPSESTNILSSQFTVAKSLFQRTTRYMRQWERIFERF